MCDLDFYEPSPNWELYLPRAIEIAIQNAMSHVIVLKSSDDPSDHGTWFCFADDRYGAREEQSWYIERYSEKGGAYIVTTVEIPLQVQG